MFRTPFPLLTALLLGAFALIAAPRPGKATDALPRSMLIIDGSGSMWGQIAGRDKIGMVRQVLPDHIAAAKEISQLGLISYGHRRRRDCRDVEVLVPIGPVQPDLFNAAISHLLPRGKTPIAAALQEAFAAIGTPGDGTKSHIVLIVDGTENCNLDPCDIAALRPDIVIDVIALGVTDKEAEALQCIASPSGGTLSRADDADRLDVVVNDIFTGLRASTAEQVVEKREPEKRTPGLYLSAALAEGTPVLGEDVSWRIYRKGEDSAMGATPLKREAAAAPVLQLGDGAYHIEARYGPLIAAEDVTLTAREALPLRLNFNAGVVTSDVRLGGNDASGDDVILTLYDTTAGPPGPDNILTHRQKKDGVFYLAPGQYSLKARAGEAEARQDFKLAAGERPSFVLLLQAGEISLSARLTENAAPLAHAQYTLYRRGEGADAVYSEFLRTLDPAPKLVLPAGDYLALAESDAASASGSFSLKPGETKSLPLVLNAGTLRLSARLAGLDAVQQNTASFIIRRLDAEAPKTIPLTGNRTLTLERPLPNGSSRDRFILPAGAYSIRAQFGNSNAVSETSVTLAAGAEQDHVAEVSAGRLRLMLVMKPGDPALPGVFWSITDAAGQQVASASRAEPKLVLREGSYALTADYLGKQYRKRVEIRPGDDKKIEVAIE